MIFSLMSVSDMTGQKWQTLPRGVKFTRHPSHPTMIDFMTTCYGKSSRLKYQTYYDLLINVCVRYDRTKMANIAKRRHIYQHPSHPTMMVFMMNYHLRLQIGIHTWV